MEGWAWFENQRMKMACSCHRKLGAFLNWKEKKKDKNDIGSNKAKENSIAPTSIKL